MGKSTIFGGKAERNEFRRKNNSFVRISVNINI